MTPIYNMKHLSAEIKFSVSEYVLAALCVPSLPLLKRKKTKMFPLLVAQTVFNEIEALHHITCTAQNRKALQLVVKTTQNRLATKASVISVKLRYRHTEPKGYKKTTPTPATVFTLLPSDIRYRSIL